MALSEMRNPGEALLNFSHPLHVGRPNIGDRDALLRRINELLDNRWLTNNGPMVQEFERRVAEILGAKHVVAMCNATVGLEIAVRALGLSGEVIVPSYTFVATAHAIQWQGITPVFVDIDPRNHNLDPAKIEASITPRTTGIVGVHVWGRSCDTETIEAIAAKHKLKVMYDASHAFGCSQRGKMLGTNGAAEVFSFHATKFINCFEGGAVVTKDDELADKMRLMRNFGFSGYDNVIYPGVNGKMSEVCAAMGLTSLDAMTDIISVNRRNYEAYTDLCRPIPGIDLIQYSPDEFNNYQYVVLDIDPVVCPLSRDQVVQVLHAHNVLARRYFFPGVHRMEPYRSFYPHSHHLLPITEEVTKRVIVMPTGTEVRIKDIQQIGDILDWAIYNAASLRQKLPEHVECGGAFDTCL
jgi:dTDP-4-amino-4,6-dideoxygalactose transaminase